MAALAACHSTRPLGQRKRSVTDHIVCSQMCVPECYLSRIDADVFVNMHVLKPQVIFLYERGCEAGELTERVHSARVHRFPSERAMLQAWRSWLQARDPDGFVLFEVQSFTEITTLPHCSGVSGCCLNRQQICPYRLDQTHETALRCSNSAAFNVVGVVQVKDTLGALQERFRALKIDGGGLPISRLQVRPVCFCRFAVSCIPRSWSEQSAFSAQINCMLGGWGSVFGSSALPSFTAVASATQSSSSKPTPGQCRISEIGIPLRAGHERETCIDKEGETNPWPFFLVRQFHILFRSKPFYNEKKPCLFVLLCS